MIKEEYNKIEDNLLNEIIKIIETFPNYDKIVKDNLNLELIPEKIIFLYNLIDNKILEYGNILDKEIESYIYKLIHYVFIKGLYTYNLPCNETSCLIDLKDIYAENEVNNNKDTNSQQIQNSGNSNFFYDYLFNSCINQTKINQLRKEKLKNVDKYDSTMGAIGEDEVEKYILKIQDTLYNFNHSYLDKEYRNIQAKSNSFFKKISDLYLSKLKKNIELSSAKFSTILTSNAYKSLKENLLKQYYKIESYIFNCNITKIENIRDKFIILLNETSSLMEFNYIILNGRVKNYYEALYNITQKSINYISDEELKEYKKRKLEEKKGPKKVWEDFKSYFKKPKLLSFKELKKNLENAWNNAKKIFDKDEETGSIWDNSFKKKEISVGIGFKFSNEEFSFSVSPCINLFNLKFRGINLPLLPFSFIDLAIKIEPKLRSDICLSVGFKVEYKNGKSSISIGASISAYVGISLSLGIYIPSNFCPLHFEFVIGIEGILGQGNFGSDLIFYLNKEDREKFGINLHYSIEAMTIKFFVEVGIHFIFDLGFFKFSFSFSYTIFEKELCKLFILEHQMVLDYLVKNSKKIGFKEIISITTKKTIKNEGENKITEKDCL